MRCIVVRLRASDGRDSCAHFALADRVSVF
jgi:hypothetical protein